MLKLRYLFENYDFAKYALGFWHHDEENLDRLLGQYRISSNAIYPFLRDGEVCILRLAPIEEKQKSNILGELEFINYLRENGYPAHEAIPSDSGETLLTLDSEWGGYYASVFRGVKGVRVDRTDMSPKIMYRCGAALAKLHMLSRQFSPTVMKWSYSEVLDWVKEVLSDCSAPDCAVFELESLRTALNGLDKKDNFGLVHYDFEPDNLFYETENDSCNVIDFDDGMYHWFSIDLVQALDAIFDEADGGEEAERMQADFLRGYESVCPILEQTRQEFVLMRRFCKLYQYARILRSTDERLENEPEWMSSLRNRLDEIMAEDMAFVCQNGSEND